MPTIFASLKRKISAAESEIPSKGQRELPMKSARDTGCVHLRFHFSSTVLTVESVQNVSVGANCNSDMDVHG